MGTLKIDQYNPQARNLGADVGPSSQLPTYVGNPGEGVSHGMDTLAAGGEAVAKVYREEQLKADAFATADRELQFSKEASDLLYDPKTGFLNQQGQNALDTAAVHEKIEALRQKYAGLLPTKQAAQDFDLRTRVRAQGYSDMIERHAAAERVKTYNATAEGTAAEAIRQARLNYIHPEEVEKNIALALPILRANWVHNNGLPPEKVAQLERAFESDTYQGVLHEYLGKQMGEEGQAYLNNPHVRERVANAGEWDGKFAPLITAQKGERIAEQVFQQSFMVEREAPAPGSLNVGKVPLAKPGKPGEAVAGSPPEAPAPAEGGDPQMVRGKMPNENFAREILQSLLTNKQITQTVYDAATARLDRKLGEFRTGYNHETENTFNDAVGAWDASGHDINSTAVQAFRADLVQRGEWHRLEVMDEAWKQHERSKQNEPPNEAQRQAFVELLWLGSTNPNAFDNMTDGRFKMEWLSKLAPSQWDEAGRFAAGLRAKPDKQYKGVDPVAMLHQIGRQNGAFPTEDDGDVKANDPATWSQEQRDVYYIARTDLQKHINAWAASHPKDPTPPQEYYETFIKDQFTKGYDPKSRKWFGLRLAELTKLDAKAKGYQNWKVDADAILDDQHTVQRNAIRLFLKARSGKEPTIQQVKDEYYNQTMKSFRGN